MAYMLDSSITSKEYVKQSIGKSAENNNFSTKKEKSDLIQNLSVTAKNLITLKTDSLRPDM